MGREITKDEIWGNSLVARGEKNMLAAYCFDYKKIKVKSWKIGMTSVMCDPQFIG